jgi:hypothetical protein
MRTLMISNGASTIFDVPVSQKTQANDSDLIGGGCFAVRVDDRRFKPHAKPASIKKVMSAFWEITISPGMYRCSRREITNDQSHY